MAKITTSRLVTTITVTDPETSAPVQVSIYKEETSGGMFGVDSSYLEQENIFQIQSPFGGHLTQLID